MRTIIYGLARTGTSALFYKLKNSLPSESICLFEPVSFRGKGRLRARLLSAITGKQPDVLAKVILFYADRPVRVGDFRDFDKQLLVVRDPRDRLVSVLLYWIYNSDFFGSDIAVAHFLALLRRKEAEPRSVSIATLVRTYEQLSAKTTPFREDDLGRAIEFHDERPGIHVFRYEDLIDGR
jgi:hypothetical protein